MRKIGQRSLGGNHAIPQIAGSPSCMEAWHFSIGQKEDIQEGLCEFDFGVQEVPFR